MRRMRARGVGAAAVDMYDFENHAYRTRNMRTNVEIDDKLLAELMELTGARTKKEAIEDALRTQLR